MSSPQHEPSMEEILASIRKIISEDTNDVQSAPSPQEPEVLELTQEVNEERVPSHTQDNTAEPSHVLEAAAVPEPNYSATHTPSMSAAENIVPDPSTEEVYVSNPAHVSSHEGIFSEKSRKAIDDAFAGLEHVRQVPKTESRRSASMPPVEGNSVEAVFERAVRASIDPVLDRWMGQHQGDLLNAARPLIREWMDEHFPALLEGAVREEVARVVKARGGR